MKHLPVALLALLPASLLFGAAADDQVTLTRRDDRIRIEIGGKLFSEYLFFSGTKPCLYPIVDDAGIPYTRDWPLRDDTKDAQDHDWHRSVWFGHGLVNGHDFWRAIPGAGRIVHDGVLEQLDGPVGLIGVRHRWEAAGGKPVCSDETTLRIRRVPGGYYVDHEITILATHGPLVFGDTEEGTLAVRVNEALRVNHGKKKDVRPGAGHIVNAAGDRDAAAWGKRAPWCDYSGPVNGVMVGVAIFDHPKNASHPTWWHVREYGLFAANAFGKHDFEKLKDQPNAGDVSVPAGGRLVLRHRLFFHRGDEKAARIAEHFSRYAEGK
ncbi:MAG: PmoA family protein [Opitutaceae bacterium]|nr:PmoA family protein [Opitutaceae bacterium]